MKNLSFNHLGDVFHVANDEQNNFLLLSNRDAIQKGEWGRKNIARNHGKNVTDRDTKIIPTIFLWIVYSIIFYKISLFCCNITLFGGGLLFMFPFIEHHGWIELPGWQMEIDQYLVGLFKLLEEKSPKGRNFSQF